jgi:hypothetical protein
MGVTESVGVGDAGVADGGKAVEVGLGPAAGVGKMKVVLVGAGVGVGGCVNAGVVDGAARLGERWAKARLVATRTRTATAVRRKRRRNWSI